MDRDRAHYTQAEIESMLFTQDERDTLPSNLVRNLLNKCAYK
jgi:hypothetical protein